jgi:hypothetical protein
MRKPRIILLGVFNPYSIWRSHVVIPSGWSNTPNTDPQMGLARQLFNEYVFHTVAICFCVNITLPLGANWIANNSRWHFYEFSRYIKVNSGICRKQAL